MTYSDSSRCHSLLPALPKVAGGAYGFELVEPTIDSDGLAGFFLIQFSRAKFFLVSTKMRSGPSRRISDFRCLFCPKPPGPGKLDRLRGCLSFCANDQQFYNLVISTILLTKSKIQWLRANEFSGHY
jgi:hypothetical protein